ncbi:MAG: choice-of-anchor Q domain-containing protein [Labilithrix sp.]
MAGLARTCVLVLVAAAGVVSACGHLPFEELPLEEDGLSGGDSGPLGPDGSVSRLDGGDEFRDGSGRADGRPPPDDGGDQLDGGLLDADLVDANVVDAGCVECNVLHVSTAGDDGNDGSIDRPLRTIGAAVLRADGAKSEIHIAGGLYDELVAIAKPNLTIKGGYFCNKEVCDWTKSPDPQGNETQLTSTKSALPPLAIKAPANSSTLITTIHVIGRSGALDNTAVAPGAVAVSVFGGSPVLDTVRIDSGNVTDGTAGTTARRSIGLYVAGTTTGESVKVVGSRIEGGTSGTASVGILVDQSGGVPGRIKVVDSVVRSSKAPISQGVAVKAGAPESIIELSEIHSGKASSANEVASWGLVIESPTHVWANRINVDENLDTGTNYCEGASPESPCGGVLLVNPQKVDLQGNFVAALPTPTSFAVMLMVSAAAATDAILNGNYMKAGGLPGSGVISAALAVQIGVAASANVLPSVRNNILRGGINPKRYGIFEAHQPQTKAQFKAVTNNDFWDVDFAYSQWLPTNSTQMTFDFASLHLAPITLVDKNINVDPKIDAEGHLADGSPCISTGTSTEVTSFDLDGESRKIGSNYDIGPDERGD